jgi:hypothetical protein
MLFVYSITSGKNDLLHVTFRLSFPSGYLPSFTQTPTKWEQVRHELAGEFMSLRQRNRVTERKQKKTRVRGLQNQLLIPFTYN